MPSEGEKEQTTEVLHVPWPRFIRDLRLNQGDHVTALGPTKAGKTTLMLQLLAKHHYPVMFATKPRDPFYDDLIRRGWTLVTKWPKHIEDDSQGRRRILFWRPTAKMSDVPGTRDAFRDAFDHIVDEGGYSPYIDELMFASSPKWLDLGDHLELGWQQWRTSKISLFVAAQRASHVPMLAYDQVEWIFCARENDLRNADRIGEMAGLDRFFVRDVVRGIPRYHWLGIEVREGRLYHLEPPKIL